MADLSLTNLIDTEVLNTDGQYFRNYEIVEATGASRQHVSQRMRALYDEGIIEKHGNSWHVTNQAKLVTRLLRVAKSQELSSTKLLRLPGDGATRLLQAILLLQGSNNVWQGYAHVMENTLLADIEESMETLRNMRSHIKNPPKSDKQIYAHTLNSVEYARSLEVTFIEAAKFFLARELTDKAITKDIRERALERINNA